LAKFPTTARLRGVSAQAKSSGCSAKAWASAAQDGGSRGGGGQGEDSEGGDWRDGEKPGDSSALLLCSPE